MDTKVKDLIIIGAGPAGLSAAIYAKRAGLDTVVLEKGAMSGGQVLTTYEVDNYPALPGIGGFDLGVKMREHADKLGTEFAEAEAQGIIIEGNLKKVITEEGQWSARAVVIAAGASHAKLGVEGEEELSGMGVSYCATCDGAFFKGKSVAVVGGGDVAVEDAVFLSRTCEKVYLIHRRDELRAARILQDALFEQPNVEVLWDTTVEKINGESAVESVVLQNKKNGGQRVLPVQGVFVAVGILPDTSRFRNIAEVDEKGYFVAGEDCATSTPGIFAAGDARKKPLRQIVTAVADGANAVTSAQAYLLGI